MHAIGSIDRDKPDDKIISTEVLIIGFGLSAIPLIRELERDGIDYAVVSDGDGSIWDKLEKHGRLEGDQGLGHIGRESPVTLDRSHAKRQTF